MRVTTFRVTNFRSFVDSGPIALGPINVLIGANNAGKSSLLRALHQIQLGGQAVAGDIRAGQTSCQIEIQLEDVRNVQKWSVGVEVSTCGLRLTMSTTDRKSASSQWHLNTNGQGRTGGDYVLSNVEPNHFIVPFLSRRKTSNYSEDVREQSAMTMSIDMSNLSAKLSRVGNPYFPNHSEYADSCMAILGFVVTSIPSPAGQRPGVYLPSREAIDIDQMGEGVPNIVQLLVNLAVSEGKLFLIEEPENDIHPRALRSLLDLILASAARNQFVISTHSNIVVSHLCGAPGSKLFKVSTTSSQLPQTSVVTEVSDSPASRTDVLAELGYSFSDLGLWDGYLILEESSAEYIIRNYLIPLFAPTLKRIRTISAGGAGNVEAAFSDLCRLSLFIHLQPAYLNRTWVIVDGDSAGQEAITKLRNRYPSWSSQSFSAFTKPQFELYFPFEFSEEVTEVLSISASDKRRAEKQRLLLKVIAWLDTDANRARSALEESAAEVIRLLKDIDGAMHVATRHQTTDSN